MDKRRITQGAILLFVVGILFTFVMGLRAQGNTVSIGDQAYLFELEDMDGEVRRLEDHLGEIVVVSFFATWCKPCEIEAPELIKFHEEFKDEVVFYSIVKSETRRNVERYIERTGYVKPYLFDFDSNVVKRFGIVGQPETIIIDREGIVVDHMIGGVTRDLLVQKISMLD